VYVTHTSLSHLMTHPSVPQSSLSTASAAAGGRRSRGRRCCSITNGDAHHNFSPWMREDGWNWRPSDAEDEVKADRLKIQGGDGCCPARHAACCWMRRDIHRFRSHESLSIHAMPTQHRKGKRSLFGSSTDYNVLCFRDFRGYVSLFRDPTSEYTPRENENQPVLAWRHE